jgi:hypothetical protein
MTMVAQVWCHMPEVILRYPYVGMDYHHDPYMMLPPREDWDQQGICLCYCFMILIDRIDNICIWMLTLYLVLFCRCGIPRARG